MKNSAMTSNRDSFEIGNAGQLNCATVEEYISLYLDGELDSDISENISFHVEGCGTCSSLIDDLRNILEIAKTLNGTPIPSAVSTRLRNALKEQVGFSSSKGEN